jgi:putative membrane protein
MNPENHARVAVRKCAQRREGSLKAAKMLLALCLSGALVLPVVAQESANGPQSNTPKHTKRDKGPKTAETAPGASNALSRSDETFIQKAIMGGLAEVKMGQLATQKAQDPAVKQFGQRMVDDHTKAGEDLKQLADKKGMNAPTEPTAKDNAEADRLSKLSGAQFDKAYMDHMVKDHQSDVSMFKSKADKAEDPDVKAAAQKTLPTLEDHLKQAQQVDAQVKGKSGNKSSANKSGKPSAFIATKK